MQRICKDCGKIFEGRISAIRCPECVELQKHNKKISHVCQTCGKTFVSGMAAKYCPDCVAERRRAQRADYQRRKSEGQYRALGSTDICELCGKPYIVESSSQRYCRDCGPAAAAAHDRQRAKNKAKSDPSYYKKRNDEREEATATRVCVVCGKEFVPHSPAITCGPECAHEHKLQYWRQYYKDHPEKKEKAHKQKQPDGD